MLFNYLRELRIIKYNLIELGLISDSLLRPELYLRYEKREQDTVGVVGSSLTTKVDWLFKKLEIHILMWINQLFMILNCQ